jgi:hypothetical protein
MIPDPRRIRRPERKAPSYLGPIALFAVVLLIGQMIWLNKHDYMFRPFSIDRLSCDVCGGTGVARDAADEDILVICPSCFGVGSHYIRRIDKSDRLCAACGGMGRVKAEGEYRTCRRCDGRGLTRDAPWRSREPPGAGKD